MHAATDRQQRPGCAGKPNAMHMQSLQALQAPRCWRSAASLCGVYTPVFEVGRTQEWSITSGACSVCCVFGTNAAASGMAEGALHSSAVSLVERVLHATLCSISTAEKVTFALLNAFDVYCRASCALDGRHRRAAASVSPRVHLPVARVLLLSMLFYFHVPFMRIDGCGGRAACAYK
jgi:hypothetical protein